MHELNRLIKMSANIVVVLVVVAVVATCENSIRCEKCQQHELRESARFLTLSSSLLLAPHSQVEAAARPPASLEVSKSSSGRQDASQTLTRAPWQPSAGSSRCGFQ